MRQSEEIDKISKALLVAQKQLTIAKKDESNAFLKKQVCKSCFSNQGCKRTVKRCRHNIYTAAGYA